MSGWIDPLTLAEMRGWVAQAVEAQGVELVLFRRQVPQAAQRAILFDREDAMRLRRGEAMTLAEDEIGLRGTLALDVREGDTFAYDGRWYEVTKVYPQMPTSVSRRAIAERA